MSCSKCNKEKNIVNKFHRLCLECNNDRLYGNKFGKVYKYTKKKKKSLKTHKNKLKQSVSNKTLEEIKKDEEFYEKCFNQSNHKCEECNKDLPTQFRDSEGKIIARYRYSHIVPKSIASHLRRLVKNINHLCFHCHFKWDMGDKKSMKIYEKNKEKFPEYFK